MEIEQPFRIFISQIKSTIMIKPKKKFKSGRSFKRIFMIGLVLTLLVGGLGMGATDLFVRSFNFSDGYRVGTIVKLSKKGVLFKTYEGQLNLGGVDADGEGGFSPIWNFSVYQGDDEVRTAISNAVDNEERVKLFYQEKFFSLSWRGDTKYFVYKVESADKD